jgi:ribosomal protein L37E
MISWLQRLFQRRRTRTIIECRQCGRILEEETKACPECGWVGIAVHEIKA